MVNTRWWDLAAVAVTAVTVIFTLIEPPYGPNEWGALATAAVFLAAYFGYLRGRIGGEDPVHHLVGTAVLAVLLGVGTAFDASFATMQSFAYPYIWVTAPSTKRAIVANVCMAAAVAAGYATHFSSDPATGIVAGIGVGTLSLAFSLALGLWITHIASIGEERARLFDELQAAQGQLAAMHRDAGVIDERARLAREIHDTIAQSLTGLVMVAQRTGTRLAPVDGDAAASARADVELIEQMAREALTEARGLVASLAPVEPGAGLSDALGRLARSFERETGVQVTVSSDVAELGRETEVVLLRTAQEGLANVRKHARAAHATISVLAAPGEVVLTVTDDGVGPGSAAPGESGFGLAGIRDRAALVGGSFSIEAGPSGGTVLRVGIPRSEADTSRHPEGTA